MFFKRKKKNLNPQATSSEISVGDIVEIKFKAKVTDTGRIASSICGRTDHFGVAIITKQGREVPLDHIGVHPEDMRKLTDEEVMALK